MSKPTSLVELREGYALAAFRGFVDFWNWMAKFVFHLKGDGAVVLEYDSSGRPVAKLSGFLDAASGTVPHKTEGGIEWKIPQSGGGGSSKILVVGTDGSSAIVGNPSATESKTLSFASKSDSNVSVSVSGSNGNATVSIGVYWRS